MQKVKRTKKEEREIEAITKELTIRQKLFCEYYAFGKDTFCNGSSSYFTAYELKESQRKWARNCAHNLLTNTYIRQYIDKLYKEKFKDTSVDDEIGKVIGQNKNLLAKMDGIKEYNKLKQRITEKTEVTVKAVRPLLEALNGKNGLQNNNSDKKK